MMIEFGRVEGGVDLRVSVEKNEILAIESRESILLSFQFL